MIKLVASVAAACLATMAAPSFAQSSPPPETSGGQRRAAPSAPPAAASQAQIIAGAACLIVREASLGEDLLATAPYSDAEREAAVVVLRRAQRCLRQSGQFSTSAFVTRGAVAEALLEGRFRELPAARTPAIPHAVWFRPEMAAARPDAASVATSHSLSRCTVERRPDLVRALLAAEPASPEEQAALQALNPVWVACVTAGTRLSIDRTSIRAFMAEDLYRWAMVQRDGAASPFAAAAAPAT